jgi:hypothetical protein
MAGCGRLASPAQAKYSGPAVRQRGFFLGARNSARAAQTFFHVTLIYLTFADAGLRKSRVVARVWDPLLTPPPAYLTASSGPPWGAGRLPPRLPC